MNKLGVLRKHSAEIVFGITTVLALALIHFVTATPPTPSSVTITSEPTNSHDTSENLSAHVSGLDATDVPHINWYVNETDHAIFNMPMTNGIVYDFAHNGLNGVVTGATFGNNGIIDGAYYFDGNDYITVPYHADLNLNTYTVIFWINATSYTNNAAFLRRGGSGRANYWFSTTSSTFRMYQNDIGSVSVATSGYPTNQWHMLAGNLNGSTINLYVDGVKVSSFTGGSWDEDDSGNMFIGAEAPGDNEYNAGWLDELRIYDYVLTDEQIAAEWNAGKGNFSIISSFETSDNSNFTACAWGIDTSGVNGSSACSSVFVIGAAPEVISISYSACGGHCNNFYVDYTPTDTGGDPMNCSLYLNTSSGSFYVNYTNYTLPSGVETTIKPNGTGIVDEGDYLWYINCTDQDGSTNTSVQTMTIDLTNPIIYWYNPLNTNTSYGHFNLSGIHTSNVSCQDTYVWKMNVSAFSDAALTTNIGFCLEEDTTNTTEWVNTTCDFNFTSSGLYYIEASCTDDHTETENVTEKLKKGKKGETVLVFNETDGAASLEVTAWFVEKGDKLTDTPGDFKSDAYEAVDRYKMWYNFTVIKPETKLMLNLTVTNGKLWYRGNLTDIEGHFIWGKHSYFDAVDLYDNMTLTIVDVGVDYAVLKIEGVTPWQGNDVIYIDPVTGGTNTQTEVVTFYYDEDEPYYTDFTINATTNTRYGNDINWSVTLLDNHNLSNFIASTNITGIWVNTSYPLPTNVSNASFTENLNLIGNVSVCGKIYFNDTSGNENETTTLCFLKNNSFPTYTDAVNGSTDFFQWSNFTANITITDDYDIVSLIFSTNASGEWLNGTSESIGDFTSFRFNNSANITNGYPNQTCWKAYAYDLESNSESSEYCFNTATVVTDSCTPPSPAADWLITDDCVLETTAKIHPYVLNISTFGSLNITPTGWLNASKVYVYENKSKKFSLHAEVTSLNIAPV